jgi:hypothetical protein
MTIAFPAESRPRHTAYSRDTARRQEIERAAMTAVAESCEEHGYRRNDVSQKKLGWDIEARNGPAVLFIEVNCKGLSSPFGGAFLDLTPNEYAKMLAEDHRLSYRLAVVSMAPKPPQLLMFAWNTDCTAWTATSGDGRFLADLAEVTSARVVVRRG